MQQHIFSWSVSNGMGLLAGYHYPFFATNGINFTADLSPINLSNGTDPATTLTFSNNAMSWHERFHYVTHAMSIESAIVRTTADAVTGDTVRYHIMSYDFTSGSSSVLTSGVLVAHTADITSAGYEQMYNTDFTIDSAAVAAGKVLIATIESDSVNSDYSATLQLNYYLT